MLRSTDARESHERFARASITAIPLFALTSCRPWSGRTSQASAALPTAGRAACFRRAPRSVVKEKLFGVNQGPESVLIGL